MGERLTRRSRWAAFGAAVALSLGAGSAILAGGTEQPSNVVPVDPIRILDTRDPTNLGLPGPFVSKVSQNLQVTGPISTLTGVQTVVPYGATGVFLSVTPVSSQADGFISVRPADAVGPPSTSNLNFTAGSINPNNVLVDLPTMWVTAGKIQITYDAYGTSGPTTDVLVDVVGYLAPDVSAYAVHADGNQVFPLTAADQTVRSVTFTPAGNGSVTVNSSATVQALDLNAGFARCSITDGDAVDLDYMQASTIAGLGAASLSGTRGFTVTGGTPFTAHLVCEKVSGNVSIFDSSMTAIFTPI